MSAESDAMLDRLNAEELTIVHAFARARIDARMEPLALELFARQVGDEASAWVLAWSNLWAAQRDRVRPDIDALALVAALPETMRVFAAARLAAPVYEDVDEARAVFLGNADMMRRRTARGVR